MRLTPDSKTWDEKEAGVQLVRDLMMTGLLRLPVEVTVTEEKKT